TIGTALSITTQSPLPAGNVSISYSQMLAASGGAGPYTWSVTGQLPPGLQLSTGGVLSGSPTTQGNYNFTARVADSVTPPRTATRVFDIRIDAAPSGLRITTLTLPTGIQGQVYQVQLQATGGPMPHTWSLITGPLPAGLTLTPSGILGGTPTAAG